VAGSRAASANSSGHWAQLCAGSSEAKLLRCGSGG
jgi:hypothetical protein